MQAYTRIKNGVNGIEFLNKNGMNLSTCWHNKLCLQCGTILPKRERTFCTACKLERKKPVKCDVEFCSGLATVRVVRPAKHEGAQLCPKHSELLQVEEAEQLKGAWV